MLLGMEPLDKLIHASTNIKILLKKKENPSMEIADFRMESITQRYYDQLIDVITILWKNQPDSGGKEGKDFPEGIIEAPIEKVPDKELLRSYLEINTDPKKQEIIIR